jgi:hypothetical protein
MICDDWIFYDLNFVIHQISDAKLRRWTGAAVIQFGNVVVKSGNGDATG